MGVPGGTTLAAVSLRGAAAATIFAMTTSLSPQPATRVAVVVSSTRPGRRGAAVADWIERAASRHEDVASGRVSVEVLDLAGQHLPLLDEPVPAIFGDYQNPHTRRWADTVLGFDAFVFAVPEYNHSIPAALKNALDYLYAEWNDKPAAVVSYGVHGGTRAVDHLRLVLAELRMIVVPTQLELALFTDFTFADDSPTASAVVAPDEDRRRTLLTMLSEVVAFSGALRAATTLRPQLLGGRSS